MAFDDVMGRVQEWSGQAQALAALGARLALLEPGATAAPAVDEALRAVTTAAGLDGLEELPPPQRGVALALIRAYLHQAVDLLDDPGRAPGWGYTDPAILDGWGRASMMMPALVAGAHEDLAGTTRFLDVGTGVGLLAIAATEVWPTATVVGIDSSPVSLGRAKEHVAAAGRGDRIELRQQDLAELTDTDEFDCVWVPSFFLSERALRAGLPNAVRSLRPGAWAVIGCELPGGPDPLGAAVAALETVRNDASALTADQVAPLLESAGCIDVHVAPPGPAPIALVLGRRPA